MLALTTAWSREESAGLFVCHLKPSERDGGWRQGLATFADPVRAQSAIDRFTSNAYDLVIDGESYRPRLKPSLAKGEA